MSDHDPGATRAAAGETKPGDEAPPGTPGTGEGLCRACGGTGQVEGRPCEACNGTGKVIEGVGGA